MKTRFFSQLSAAAALVLELTAVNFVHAAGRGCEPDLGSVADALARKQAEARAVTIKKNEAIQTLLEQTPILFGEEARLAPWYTVLENQLQPGRASDLISIELTGGIGAGRTTVLKTIRQVLAEGSGLEAEIISAPIGHRRGVAGRPYVLHSEVVERVRGIFIPEDLRLLFPDAQKLIDPEDLRVPGPPLFGTSVALDKVANVAVVDRPIHLEEPAMPKATPERPGDVLFVVLFDHSLSDFRLISDLHDRLKIYGAHPMVVIVRTEAKRAPKFRDVKEWADEFARRVYGLPDGSRPPGLLAVYAMPEDREVLRQKALPALIPLDDTPPFRDLITKVSDESISLRNFPALVATREILRVSPSQPEPGGRPGGGVMTVKDVNELLMVDVYLNIIEDALTIPPMTVDFPFDEAPLTWLRAFEKERTWMGRGLSLVAGAGFHAKRSLFRERSQEPSIEKLNEKLKPQLRAAWLRRLSEVADSLARGQIDIRASSARDIEDQLNLARSHFPSPETEFVLNSREASNDRVRLHLPALFKEFNDVTRILLNHLIDRLGKGTLDKPSGITEDLVRQSVEDYMSGRYKHKHRAPRVGSEATASLATAVVSKLGLGLGLPIAAASSTHLAYRFFEKRVIDNLRASFGYSFEDAQYWEYQGLIQADLIVPLRDRILDERKRRKKEALEKILKARQVLEDLP